MSQVMKRIILLLSLAVSVACAGECRLADVFGDGMVLQRRKPAAVWGTADPGSAVTVQFADQAKTAKADAKGKWLLRLDPMGAATNGQTLTVKSGKTVVAEVKDVLVGDVWICGGQSNMGRSVNSSWRPKEFNLDQPMIRCFWMRNRGQRYPETQLLPVEPDPKRPTTGKPNAWNVCLGDVTMESCAEGVFFAERLHRETGVPQGLLWNAWSGSVAKEWITGYDRPHVHGAHDIGQGRDRDVRQRR